MKYVDLKQAEAPHLRLLVYGDSGSGKTHFIGSAMECPETCPVLVLSAMGQPISLRHLDPPPLVVEIEGMKDFNQPYSWFRAGQIDHPRTAGGMFETMAKSYLQQYGFERFKTIAVDSITHTQRISLEAIVGSQGTAPGDMPIQAQIQHWGGTLRQIVNLTNLYFKLPVHVIMSALTKWTTVENMGLTMFGPFLWGQSSLEVPSYAEIVGRMISIESMSAGKVNILSKALPDEFAGAFNALLLRGGRNFIAKWQGLANPPELILGPTVGKMLERLNEGGDS